jgi:hypothetical protein
MIDWRALAQIPENLKAGAQRIVYAGGKEWIDDVDGGWVNLVDATHTQASPQAITGGTKTHYTVDGLGAATDQRYGRRLALGAWDDSTFAPRNVGDAYTIRLTFTLSPTSTASGQSLEVDLGIGSGWNTNVFAQTIPIIKSQGVSDLFSVIVPIFCLETFGNFGGRFYLTPSHDCTVYGKAIFIQRTFAP